MSSPLVSVIIPAYNRESTIARAIRSVQEQTFEDWELIVVDDASTDSIRETVEEIRDARIAVVRQAKNGGPSVARQAGLERARGEYVAFLDSDDEWLRPKLEVQLRSEASAVSCGYLVHQAAKEWAFVHPPVHDWVRHLHVRCMLRAGSTLLARRKAVFSVGGFDPELRYYEDWDLALRLAEAGPLEVVPEALVRIHVGGARSVIAADPSIRRFLSKHDSAFRRFSRGHRMSVRGQHLQNLAAGAYAERAFGLGSKCLLESFRADPLQNPIRLAALFLAPIDALFGTRLIERAAERVRSSTGGNAPKPAP